MDRLRLRPPRRILWLVCMLLWLGPPAAVFISGVVSGARPPSVTGPGFVSYRLLSTPAGTRLAPADVADRSRHPDELACATIRVATGCNFEPSPRGQSLTFASTFLTTWSPSRPSSAVIASAPLEDGGTLPADKTAPVPLFTLREVLTLDQGYRLERYWEAILWHAARRAAPLFLTCSIAGAVLPALAYAAIRIAFRPPKPGCCVKCGYSLQGLIGEVCPECGQVNRT